MFNDIYFDDVRVPQENMVGEENKGWYVSLMTMNFERSSIGAISEARRTLEELVQFCRETKRGGRPLAEDPLIRSRLAQLAIELEAGRALSYQVAWLQGKGPDAVMEAGIMASAAKLYSSELGQRFAYTACEIMGPFCQVKEGSKWAPLYGRFQKAYQDCMGINIAGGSSEIQRNVIAIRGLGLPRPAG